MAIKAKLGVLSGSAFDKSYFKGMVGDHQEDLKEFQTDASTGQDPDAKAYAAATLPTLKPHLKKIQAIVSSLLTRSYCPLGRQTPHLTPMQQQIRRG